MDSVIEAVRVLEDDGCFNAGRGSVLAEDMQQWMDAALMDGWPRRAGAVAAVQDLRLPIDAAASVLRDRRHVLLAGTSARTFAISSGCEAVGDEWRGPPQLMIAGLSDTVGAVARDGEGHLAAATSTGGLPGKRAGRVGDSPVIGSGTWADARVAVSCTGDGEYFIRTAAAHRVACRMEFGSMDLDAAAKETIDQVRSLGGDGGIIALGRDGSPVCWMSTLAMARAYWVELVGICTALDAQEPWRLDP
jgi:beta-aspartyl-peptidase (threonine type)